MRQGRIFLFISVVSKICRPRYNLIYLELYYVKYAMDEPSAYPLK